MDLSFDPDIPLLEIYLKKPKTLIQKNINKHPYAHCSIIFNLQGMQAAQVPSSSWVDKTTMGHCTMEYYLAVKKKKENFTLCDSMDGPGEHYAK